MLKIDYSLELAHYGAGVSYDALGDQNSAIYHYVKAINLDPDSSIYKQALDNYMEVSEMQPWNSEALYNLGMVRKEMRDYESAIENFSETRGVAWLPFARSRPTDLRGLLFTAGRAQA